MLKNYLTIAIRNLLRQKLYAFINTFGLALGIACCLLMVLFVKHEWSFDRFHKNRAQIFRLVTQETGPNGKTRHQSLFLHTLSKDLKNDLPGVTRATVFMRTWNNVTYGDQVFGERIGFADNDFLTMFTFPLLAGNPTTALDRPDAAVVSETVATKLFGPASSDYNAFLGRTIEVNGATCEITGILSDVPNTSSMQFDVLIPPDHCQNFSLSYIDGGYAEIYAQLVGGQIPQNLTASLKSFADTHLGKRIENLKSWKAIPNEQAFTLTLQPLLDVYWNEHIQNTYESSGDLTAVYILWGLSILVLLIACSNFTTMSVARSTGRALEVGLRKVLGADRRQVMQQFWSEALLLSFIGLSLGVALAELFLPIFNGLVQRNLNIAYADGGFFILLLLVIVFVVGLISGSYPAVVLSRFQPISALKGEQRLGGRSHLTRALIVMQYTASIALMICTGVMLEQQHYISNKKLGYDQEHIIVVNVEYPSLVNRYKQEILKDPHIINATISDRAFTNGSNAVGCKMPDGRRITVRVLAIDTDYLSTLKIPLVDGRNFSEDRPTDRQQAILINETLARKLDMGNPIGKQLPGFKYRDIKPDIIGIVRDFHIDSLHRRIQPLVMYETTDNFSNGPFLITRVQPGEISQTIANLEQTWHAMVPHESLRWSFLDKNLERQYRSDQRWQRVLTYSAVLAIAISCLGLLGLASLTVARRTKEIGIRKVLGASMSNLVNLFSKDFVKLLILANLIAWPIAYWAMDKWLTNFAYHIHLGIGAFALSGVLALVIALLTISAQTLKAAHRNPVDALKCE